MNSDFAFSFQVTSGLFCCKDKTMFGSGQTKTRGLWYVPEQQFIKALNTDSNEALCPIFSIQEMSTKWSDRAEGHGLFHRATCCPFHSHNNSDSSSHPVRNWRGIFYSLLPELGPEPSPAPVTLNMMLSFLRPCLYMHSEWRRGVWEPRNYTNLHHKKIKYVIKHLKMF